MLSKMLMILMVVTASVSPSIQDNLITFGINLALDTTPEETSALTPLQLQAYQGLVIFKEWWNNLPASLRIPKWSPEPIQVELHIEQFSNYTYDDAYSNFFRLYDIYANMHTNSSINYMFLPVSSPWDIQIRNWTYTDLHIPLMVAIADSSEVYFSIPGSFGSTTANILTMTSYLPYLRVARASTVALIQADEIYQTELCQGVLDNAQLNDLQIVGNWTMPFDYNSWGVPNTEDRIYNWTTALETIIDLDVDALFICDYGLGAEWALNYLRQKNWLPKSVTLSTLYLPFSDPTLLDYVTMLSSYNKESRIQAQANFYNSSGFYDLVQSRWGVSATDVHARATLAGMLYMNAILSAATNSTADVITAMEQSQYTSFMGTSYFDNSRRQEMLMLVLQLFDSGNTSRVIGPATAAADSLIYPLPQWQERIFAPKWGSPVEIAGAVLMSLGLFINLFWVFFLLWHRTHSVMLAASPVFCLGILAGSMLVFISIFTWMPNLVNRTTCYLRTWLLPLGFMMMFASLLAKSDRIYRIYYAIYETKRHNKAIRISNLQVGLIVLALCLGQAILSSIMIALPGTQSDIHVEDPYRVSKNFYVCTFPTALKVLFGINVAYAACLLGWGSFLAYKLRNVPISAYDESKIIGFSIYNVAVFAALVVIIQLAVGNSSRDLTFITTAVFCFLGAVVTTCTLFVNKFLAIYFPQYLENRSSRDSATSMTLRPYQHTSLSSSADSIDGPSLSPSSKKKDEDVDAIMASMRRRISELEQGQEVLKKENKSLKKRLKKMDEQSATREHNAGKESDGSE